MSITWPTDTTTKIDQMRAAIGRPVQFRTVTYSGCGTCSLDPVSNNSTDSFCPACSGLYWIPQRVNYTLTGHITWGKANSLDWYPTGQQYDGDVRIQIKYSATNVGIIELTEDIVVDGKVVEVKSEILRGVPNVNRILLDCIEKEKSA